MLPLSNKPIEPFFAFVTLVIDCGPLENPKNGSVSVAATTVNSIAYYQCNSGFTLVGEAMRVCQKDSTWSGRPPVCIGESQLQLKTVFDVMHCFIDIHTHRHVSKLPKA